MKKIMKIVIPVLLSILIFASIFWYCFVYDRDFTRDVLLQQARFHSTNGIPALSSWFYDLAYEHSGQDENVAIELANQFKAVGNYTKAEVTLSQAIADGGNAEIYIALCKTYVEQDKLLDAVNMLDSIADPAIKAQLDALRPAAPVSDPVPGFYSDYIPVSLVGEGGTLYFVMDDEYPSTDDIPYSESITLPAGVTTIRAITVANNGLVSPLSTMEFTVGGVIEPVIFTDASIDIAVRSMLGIDEDKTLFSNDLWNIKAFTVPEEAMNLQELSHLPYLESLTISNYTFDSLDFLSALGSLKTLTMTDCRFPAGDLEVIASLPELTDLTLNDCGISTIAGLEKAQKLAYLDLGNNTVRNLEPLSSLLSLKTINLNHNALTSLTALSALSNLEELDVSYNSLTSIAPIATCRKLKNLNVANNSLSNLGAVDNLPELTVLTANHNELTDIEILANCTGLVELDVSNNNVSQITYLSALEQLEIFKFAYNQVDTIPSWSASGKLRLIDGSHNQIKSIASLKVLQKLTHIYMDYNAITSVADLASCYSLVMVNVYGNEIKDGVDALAEHDIIVNYDPT